MRRYNRQEMCQRVFQDGIASQSFYLQDVRGFSHRHTNSHAEPWSHNFYDCFLPFRTNATLSRGVIIFMTVFCPSVVPGFDEALACEG
jgi:hypothetical protein